MAAITASMVGALRAKTDAPMMECKKALTEADGDMDKAEELLRVKLGSKAGKAASRIAAEGVVAATVEGTTGALIEVNCETDFVTKNDSFLAFAKSLSALVAEKNPADVAALAALPLSQDGFGPTVEDVRKGLIGKIGENMSIRRFQRYAGGGRIASYLHGTRIGVLVEFEGDETAAKDVAMHVAAMKPKALTTADVAQALIAAERSVATLRAAEDAEKAKAEGKAVQSPEIVAKRIEGSVAKFLKEVSLHNQAFVKNDKQTVEQMLKEKATTRPCLHALRRRRGDREEDRRLRGRGRGAGRRGQGRLSRRPRSVHRRRLDFSPARRQERRSRLHGRVQAHPAQAFRRSLDGRRCVRHQSRDDRSHRPRGAGSDAARLRGRGRDRRRQHLPRRRRRLGRHGPRDRRLHGHAGDGDERARARRHDAPGRHHGARDVGDRDRAGGRALRAAEGAAVPRGRQGRDLRRRHRQPVLHDRHRRGVARRRDRRRRSC